MTKGQTANIERMTEHALAFNCVKCSDWRSCTNEKKKTCYIIFFEKIKDIELSAEQ